MHEHVTCAFGGINQNYPELLGPDVVGRGAAALAAAKAGGVKTIVDATVIDIGRDIELIAETARLSGVNIIAASGWWLHASPFLAAVPVDRLADVFVREIEEGIAGTGIKSGILKSASDMPGVTDQAALVLRAIARAHHKTGAPIMVHSYPTGQVGRQQLAILLEEASSPTASRSTIPTTRPTSSTSSGSSNRAVISVSTAIPAGSSATASGRTPSSN
jgi:phosphotriesterase-related protein